MVSLDWPDLKSGTRICLFCGGLSLGRPSCRTEDFVSFGCCAYANEFCVEAGVWAHGRSGRENPHGHELPSHWPLDSPTDVFAREKDIVAQHFARHEAEGTAIPFLKEPECA